MSDISDYRETPRTGRTPAYARHEEAPEAVDPSVLTDDRPNPNLLVFEKTWGHRLLAGLGVAMVVIAAILVVYSIIQLFKLSDVMAIAPDVGTLGVFLYGTWLVAGIVIIAPAVVGIYVAKHPDKVNAALVMAALGIAAAFAFFAYAVISAPQFLLQAVLYTALLAVLPIVYLVAALKIKRAQ